MDSGTMTADKKRGRPRRSATDQADRRDQIITIARQLFRQDGFDAVSMRKIANAVNMSPMSLYQYFAGKTEILHHIWAESFDLVLEKMQSAYTAAADPVAGYRAAIHAYMAFFLDRPDLFRVIFLNEDRADSKDRFFVDHSDIDNRLRQIFTPSYDMLMTGKNDEEIALFEQGMYHYLHGLLLNVISISEYNWQPPEKLLDQYLDMALAVRI